VGKNEHNVTLNFIYLKQVGFNKEGKMKALDLKLYNQGGHSLDNSVEV
jgi:xanthine dehydrogenase molybdopterin-binding subunit B